MRVDDAETADASDVIELLRRPKQLWTRDQVLERPSPVPASPGIYGWHFTKPPAETLAADQLLYVGIAPRHISTRSSTQTLRHRIRYHFRGNAEGSTLRLTLGCLLGLELRRVGSGRRMTFGNHGETELSTWMTQNARVCWYSFAAPWTIEPAVIAQTAPPLNLAHNHDHPFHSHLTNLRAEARTRARQLPILTTALASQTRPLTHPTDEPPTALPNVAHSI